MLASLILVFTLGCISWSLWVRRATWRCRYEVAITITLVLQGFGLVLTSSFASATLGLVLQRAVGHFNFEDFIAHSVNVVSLCLIAVSVAGRLRSAAGDGALRRQFKICVEYPVSLIIPILLLLFWHSPGAAHTYLVYFRAVSTETWLTAYWVVLCLLQGWLISYICWLLLALRRDPRSTKTASVYLVALMMGAV